MRDPDLPPDLWGAAYARVLRGIADDVAASMPHPERLEPRTRHVAALGRALPAGVVRWARQAERAQAERILGLFDDGVDVLLTPGCAEGPYEAGTFTQHGTAWWIAFAAKRIPYFAAYNVTGTPAIAVPAGFDAEGLPVGVQLAGRTRDEATLIALAAQLEAAAGGPGRRPPE